MTESEAIAEFDLFISHASEDKASFVQPLARQLADLGVRVWYDEFTLKVGDSLSRSIDKGLARSRYGLVVLSKAFIVKPWTEYELRGLVSREIGKGKIILPIWLNVTKEEIVAFSPPLADKVALDASKHPIAKIVVDILEVVRPDIHDNLMRRLLWKQLVEQAVPAVARASDLHPGPIRHPQLPDHLLTRIRLIHSVVGAVLDLSLEQMIEAFQRDAHPFDEVAIWEKVCVVYQEATHARAMDQTERREILSRILWGSFGGIGQEGV